MTQEEKQLLLKNLCARLPYGVKATTTSNGWNGAYTITGYVNDRIYLDCPVYGNGDDEWLVESIKPYLRPMSSMTEEEQEEYYNTMDIEIQRNYPNSCDFSESVYYSKTTKTFDWLNANHFDYRGLIPMGLALGAPEGMYND